MQLKVACLQAREGATVITPQGRKTPTGAINCNLAGSSPAPSPTKHPSHCEQRLSGTKMKPGKTLNQAKDNGKGKEENFCATQTEPPNDESVEYNARTMLAHVMADACNQS